MAEPDIALPMEGLRNAPLAEESVDYPFDDDVSVRTEISEKSGKEKVMECIESRYQELAEVLKSRQTVPNSLDLANSFHLAEEDKQDFPDEYAHKVTEGMVSKLLTKDSKKRMKYLKSMFFCVTPESLTPLAVLMYQEFEDTFPENLSEVFQYEDEKKVMQLYICLLVREKPLSDKAKEAAEGIQATMEKMINTKLEEAPKQLLAAFEQAKWSFYTVYHGRRKISREDAKHITEGMEKHLTAGTDKERKAFLASMYFALQYRALFPLVIAMFQKYRERCPDKLELLKGKEWNSQFLGRVLFRQGILRTEAEYYQFNKKLSSEEQEQENSTRRQKFESQGLSEIANEIFEDTPMYACDLLNYYKGSQMPYQDALSIAKLMLPYLNGDEHQREIYVRTMNKLSYRRRFWRQSQLTAGSVRKYAPDGDIEQQIIGEYSNIAIIMCQQYQERFPAESYSELEDIIIPHFIYLYIVKCLWEQNALSEVTVSFYVESILRARRHQLTISLGLIPLLLSLPTTVYMPVFVKSQASDFSESVWIQSSTDFNQIEFMKILVNAAIEREGKSIRSRDKAIYQVLMKAIKNPKSAGMKVELLLDALTQQIQPEDCDTRMWDSSDSVGGRDALYLLAARRGPRFVNAAFKLLEFLHSKESKISRVVKLIEDEYTDDRTVANIISKMIECRTVHFDDDEKVEFAKCCFSYTGSNGRVHTAKVIWKAYSDLLTFVDLLSTSTIDDVPLAILEEFYVSPDNEIEKKNSLHVAAEKGYTKVVELALERDFGKLLRCTNGKDQYPVQVALNPEADEQHYDIAAIMLQEMNDYKLCLASTDGEPRVNFRDLLNRLKEISDSYFKLIKEHKNDDEEHEKHQKRIKHLEECVMAILNSTVHCTCNCKNPHHEVLEVKGRTPSSKDFECPDEHIIELVMNNTENFQAIIDHESFISLVDYKWKLYGRKLFMINFVTYCFFLILLTTAFVLGAVRAGSPSNYNQPLDWFRLFCEILVLLLIMVDIIFEIIQFYHSKLKYFYDWTNWLENLAIALTILIIPFRIANLDVQWVFVALAYIFNSLRIFKYAALESSFAVYVKTLFRIIIRDIVKFLAVFLVITIAFGGGLYFSLRADTCRLADQDQVEFNFTPVANSSLCLHPDETSEIYWSWLTGLRLLIEGNVIDPYIFGDRGFWWFSVIIYIVFLFLVAIIMLNLLIAQFSKSYEEITKKTKQSVTPDRAKILVEQESAKWAKWIKLCCGLVKLDEQFMCARKLQCCKKSKKSDEDTVDDWGKIHKQLSSSTSTHQKQFKELQKQLKEVKADIAKSEAVEELKSEVKSLLNLHEQQQRQIKEIKESLKSLGEVKDILRQMQKPDLQKPDQA